ncbi:MAG: hypothetical protein QM537_04290, partial [Candidatus Symbiobacter sp.]|nr:hypothetical protein [Candidatus Symbiobacter sp.]
KKEERHYPPQYPWNTDIVSRVIPQEYYSLKLLGDYPTRTASGNPLAVRRVMTLTLFAAHPFCRSPFLPLTLFAAH